MLYDELMKKRNSKHFLIPATIIVLYLILHLIKLTNLPVFADEAIYIRWAQLIIDDWQQYLFFPLNDGKTPLFIWLLVPWQFVIKNQLLAGRLLSVLVGTIQVVVMGQLAYVFTKQKQSRWLTMLLTSILPFFYFHHRIALMDSLLTLLLSLSFLMIITAKLKMSIKQPFNFKEIALAVVGSGFFFGLSMLTKIPALLYIPALVAFIIVSHHASLLQQFKTLTLASLTIMMGLGLFLALKLHPAFGQLFNRGNDFLFSWQEIFLQGKWQDTLPSISTYLNYLGQYLTWPLLLLSVAGLFTKKARTVLALHLAWLGFAGPMFLMARVLYPRYILPVSIFVTLAAIISWQQLRKKSRWLKIAANSLVAITIIYSSRFIYFNVTDVSRVPFVAADQVQYLTSWSAGYGVKPTIELVQEISRNKRVSSFV